MKTVLVKLPRSIAEKILAEFEIPEMGYVLNPDAAIIKSAFKDALASKPLNERE
jgi:hypothetical protein